ncbi:MAG: DUF362 domain-containing protein [Clostridia bacterium]|nr:DUF362 domain-containing protein [Clostridia bacterium]
MSKIYQVYGQSAHEMTLQLLETAQAVRLVPSQGNVVLKPNLVIAGTPESGATTHPGVLSGCIEYFQSHGVQQISVMEGSWIGDNTMRAMQVAGYDQVCRKYNVPFFDLKKDKTRTVETAIGKMDICQSALDAGLLVDLPVLKGHGQTIMTCALKNLKGCLPDREKRHFHAMGLHRPIAALGAYLKPRLIVVDSICGDLDFEEGGNPVTMNRMYLGTDAVQLDAYGCQLMGIDLEAVPYIFLCEQFGGGSTAMDPSDLVELNHPEAGMETKFRKPAGIVGRITRNVQADSACSACFAALARALYVGNMQGTSDMHIGQGWRGKSFEGIGIGNCCSGGTSCVHGCPPTADAVLEALTKQA